jgi:ElaB/YqjD/DUF883 family membrane-anchored ribosome-binding protein
MRTKNRSDETSFIDVTKERLIADFKMAMSDAEALIKATANQGGDAVATVRAKAEKSLAMAKANMTDTEEALLARTRAAAKATDVFVRENPWQVIGVGASIGLLIGFLMGRR